MIFQIVKLEAEQAIEISDEEIDYELALLVHTSLVLRKCSSTSQSSSNDLGRTQVTNLDRACMQALAMREVR